MARKIVIAVALLFVVVSVGFCVVVSLQPSNFSVERTAMMAAEPATVFAQVNDLE